MTTIAMTVRPRVTFSLSVEGTTVGADGLSAYEIWLAEGNEGTEQDFLDSFGIGEHETTYDHTLIATALQSESDPVFAQWLNDTPPAYPDDIPSDTGDLTNNAGFIKIGDVPAETDPLFSEWIGTTPPAYPGDLHSPETPTSISNLLLTSLQLTRGNYIYHAVSKTADTAGDWRQYADANGFYTQYCEEGSATKGDGNWITKFTIEI